MKPQLETFYVAVKVECFRPEFPSLMPVYVSVQYRSVLATSKRCVKGTHAELVMFFTKFSF